MSPWLRHPSDALLSEVAEGGVTGSARKRIVGHLRRCDRCAQRHERLVLLDRALSGGRPHEPSETELAALREANRAAVLAAARSTTQPAAPPWKTQLLRIGPALGAVAVVLAGVWIARLGGASPDSEAPPEFTARGTEGAATQATLRVFCAREGAALTELDEDGRCPAGASLAFAVRLEELPRALTLEVRGGAVPEVHPIPIRMEPGQEFVLPITVTLEGSGLREVALTADGRTLTRTVRVEDDR